MKPIAVLYLLYFVPLGLAAAYKAWRVPTVLVVTALHFVAGAVQSNGSLVATARRRYGRALPWVADTLILMGLVAAALATRGWDGLWDETLPVWGLALATAGNLLCLADHRRVAQRAPLVLVVALLLLVPRLINFSTWNLTLVPAGDAGLPLADDAGCSVSWIERPAEARNSAIADCGDSVQVIAGGKDRTLARLNISRYIWQELGGELVEYAETPRGAAGLYSRSTIVGNASFFWLTSSGLVPLLPRQEEPPAVSLDADSKARYLVHNEVVGNLDYQCCSSDCRRLLVRHDGNHLTLMGPVMADNMLGVRFDHGRLRSTVGSFSHLSKCPSLFHVNPAHARALWQQHRHKLAGTRLVAQLDRWVAEHGDDARKSFAAWSDGKGAFRSGAFYNSFVARALSPSDTVGTRQVGGQGQVPRTYDGHVKDLREYLQHRGDYVARVAPGGRPPPTGTVGAAGITAAATAIALVVGAPTWLKAEILGTRPNTLV